MNYHDLPIKRKLLLALMLTSGVALLLACGAFVAAEWTLFRRELVDILTTRARMIAANSTSSLAFENAADAEEVLSALRADRRVVAAALYDKEGKVFARFPANAPNEAMPERPEPDGHRFTKTHLLIFHPVVQGDRRLGTLFFKTDLSALQDRLALLAWITLGVVVAAAAVALALSARLQGRISQPILALADAARIVTDRKDYSIRVPPLGGDETGQLTAAFNEMLARIQQHASAVLASEVRFRSLVTATSQIVWNTDPEGRVNGPLPTWQAFTGQSDAQIQGTGWAEALHPDDMARTLETWKHSVATKTLYDTEYRVRRHDGIYRHFVARGVPVLNEDGSIREWVGTCADIHDRKAAEQALRESEERLHTALASSGVGTWNWNIPESSITWDDYLHPLFGLQPRTFPGRYEDFLALLHPEDRERVTREVSASVEKGAPYDNDYRVVWPDGRVRWLASRGKVYRDDAGRPLRMTGVCWDVTDRKEAEERINRFTEELKRSNAELERFAYVSSHDLQEPLRTVASFAQLLGSRYRGKLDADADEFIQFIVDGANRMQTLINDLLAYSRVGTQGKPFAPVEFERVFHDVMEDLDLAIEESGAVVTRDPLPAVRGDGVQLRQLLQNLVGNAIKFRQPGEPPRVHVGAARDGAGWQFSVRDNGIGIDPQYFERVFIIFQRLHGRDDYPGTGIGLAVCKKIVERHGGRIWVESEPGRGSTFHFTLPDTN
jgi:PAS domain S-box-containing protein